MRKKAVWTASVLGAAALLAAFCLLVPRRYPVPADTTIGTRSIRYEDRPKTAAEIGRGALKPEQPVKGFGALRMIFRQEMAEFFRQIKQDRPGFENAYRRVDAVIHQRRDF